MNLVDLLPALLLLALMVAAPVLLVMELWRRWRGRR